MIHSRANRIYDYFSLITELLLTSDCNSNLQTGQLHFILITMRRWNKTLNETEFVLFEYVPQDKAIFLRYLRHAVYASLDITIQRRSSLRSKILKFMDSFQSGDSAGLGEACHTEIVNK